MKKAALLLAVLVLFGGIALADPFNPGDALLIERQVGVAYPTAAGPGSGGAGLFKITNLTTGAVILTFCLEADEFIGNKVLSVTDAAIDGGVGGPSPDPLDKMSAWLYVQYLDGVLTDIKALQLAIWFIEDELPNWDLSDLETYYKAAADYYNLATSNATSLMGVQVLNVTDQHGINRQDFLIRVPEPASLVLLGIGILGFGLIRRRE